MPSQITLPQQVAYPKTFSALKTKNKQKKMQTFQGGLEKLDLWFNMNLTKRNATVLHKPLILRISSDTPRENY